MGVSMTGDAGGNREETEQGSVNGAPAGNLNPEEAIESFCEQFDQLLHCSNEQHVQRKPSKHAVNRKEARYNRVVEHRRVKRKEERIRRRERKKQEGLQCFHLESPLEVMIDIAFTEEMNDKELGKLVRQMGRVWGLNKKYEGLSTTLLSPSDRFLEEGRRVLTGFDSFKWHISYLGVQESSNKQLVYLSPDADLPPLLDVSPTCAYVIGGLVDETGAGSLSKERAESRGIEARRLPIIEYMRKGERGTFNVMLSINQVVEALVLYARSRRWDQALAEVVPKRSGYLPMDS